MKTIIRALMVVLIWAAVIVFLALEGCSYHANSYPGTAWAAAWACRCDTCCDELDRIAERAEIERQGTLEGVQL